MLTACTTCSSTRYTGIRSDSMAVGAGVFCASRACSFCFWTCRTTLEVAQAVQQPPREEAVLLSDGPTQKVKDRPPLRACDGP